MTSPTMSTVRSPFTVGEDSENLLNGLLGNDAQPAPIASKATVLTKDFYFLLGYVDKRDVYALCANSQNGNLRGPKLYKVFTRQLQLFTNLSSKSGASGYGLWLVKVAYIFSEF